MNERYHVKRRLELGLITKKEARKERRRIYKEEVPVEIRVRHLIYCTLMFLVVFAVGSSLVLFLA